MLNKVPKKVTPTETPSERNTVLVENTYLSIKGPNGRKQDKLLLRQLRHRCEGSGDDVKERQDGNQANDQQRRIIHDIEDSARYRFILYHSGPPFCS